MARPPISSSQPLYHDPATEENTAILAQSSKAESLAKHRSLCRANGIHDGPQELRRLQHFVSQAIIRLLTNFNITQKDGRPYTSSCPKGFLQGPDIWLLNCGYYLSGWPHGLPSGSISIWPSHYTFALAAMFINNTITLKPLGQAPEIRRRIEELAALPRPPKKPKYQKKETREKPSTSGKNNRTQANSSGPPPGTTTTGVMGDEMHANVRLVAPVAVRARAISVESEEGYGRPHRREYITDDDLDAEGSLDDSLVSVSGPGIGAGTGAGTGNANSIAAPTLYSRKRGVDEHHYAHYYSTPTDATIDWIPPVSAARDVKRMRISV